MDHSELSNKRASLTQYATQLDVKLSCLKGRKGPAVAWARSDVRSQLDAVRCALAAAEVSKEAQAAQAANAGFDAKRAELLAQVERDLQAERRACEVAGEALREAEAAANARLNAFSSTPLRRGLARYHSEFANDTADLARVAPDLAGYVPGDRNTEKTNLANNKLYHQAHRVPPEVFVFMIADEGQFPDADSRAAFAERWRQFADVHGLQSDQFEAGAKSLPDEERASSLPGLDHEKPPRKGAEVAVTNT